MRISLLNNLKVSSNMKIMHFVIIHTLPSTNTNLLHKLRRLCIDREKFSFVSNRIVHHITSNL